MILIPKIIRISFIYSRYSCDDETVQHQEESWKNYYCNYYYYLWYHGKSHGNFGF